jgi:hypothetical protein
MLARNNRGTDTIRDVMRTAVAMEQLNKHVSAENNSRNNRRAVFSVWSVLRAYEKDKEDYLSKLSFEMPDCQYTSFGAEELN